jgi:hypothetical protein
MTPERQDAWTPEVCGQKCTAETSVARKRLAETHFRDNECAGMNRGVGRRLWQVSWQLKITEKSTVWLGVLYSVRMKLVQSEIETTREREREG